MLIGTKAYKNNRAEDIKKWAKNSSKSRSQYQ